MPRRITTVGTLLVAGVLLAGCSQVAEQAAETATGVDVDISGDSMTMSDDEGTVTVEDGGDTVTYEGEDGTSVVTGSGAELPPTFPADIPVPPDATILSSIENGEGAAVIWNAEGLTEEAFEAWVDEVRAAGYDQEVSSYGAPQPQGFTKAYELRGNGLIVSVTGMGDAGTGQITLSSMPE